MAQEKAHTQILPEHGLQALHGLQRSQGVFETAHGLKCSGCPSLEPGVGRLLSLWIISDPEEDPC